MAQASGFCSHCGEQRLLLREGPNHVLHLILTVLTFGLWVIVWIAVGARKQARAARCSICGTEMHKVYVPGQGTIWQA
jgi:hypothetical protein